METIELFKISLSYDLNIAIIDMMLHLCMVEEVKIKWITYLLHSEMYSIYLLILPGTFLTSGIHSIFSYEIITLFFFM